MNPTQKQTLAAPARSRLRNIELSGPAGKLEAILNEGQSNPRFAALVAHPHPLGGGTMHNKVVYHAMKALNDPAFGFAAPVLRFNFRGTGLSEGVHDGEAEQDDLLAALDWLRNAYSLPILAVGFSFGAAMTVKACTGEKAFTVMAMALLGLPLHALGRTYLYPHLADSDVPSLLLSGSHDQFSSPDGLKDLVASSHKSKKSKTVLIEGADHFFTSRTGELQLELAAWLKELEP